MFRFPWGDFHSLNLGWFLQKFNELLQDWATAEAGIDGALDAEIQKAEDALTNVFAARDAAAASASAANNSALNASQSSLASMDARDQSRAARDAAQQAARNAASSETAAGNSATAARNSAGAAATSATQAGNSATAAGNSATAAGQSATNAAASETAAGNSAAAAAASETAAGQSARNAEDAAASITRTPEDEIINNIFNTSNQFNEFGRNITVNKNIINQNFVSANVIPQSTTLTGTGGTINETISNYRPTISQLKPIALLPKKFLLNAFFDIVGQSFTVAVAIKFCQVDESENITYLPFVTATADQTQKLSSAEINLENYPTATHFSIICYTRNSDPTIPTKIVIGIKPQTILNSDLTQLQASLLENMGG